MKKLDHYYLKDKTILITGAAGILGSSLAREACNFDANVILTDFNKDKLNTISQDLLIKNKNVHSVHLDLSSKESIDLLLKDVLKFLSLHIPGSWQICYP